MCLIRYWLDRLYFFFYFSMLFVLLSALPSECNTINLTLMLVDHSRRLYRWGSVKQRRVQCRLETAMVGNSRCSSGIFITLRNSR